MASVKVRLQVKGDVDCGASMFVVGSCPELGNWQARGALELQFQPQSVNGEDGVWELYAELPRNLDISYRYFQGKVIPNQEKNGAAGITNATPSGGRRVVEVWKWETNIEPRCITTPDADILEPPEAVFGSYGGSHTVSYGWLENHACIQVRFHSNPVYMWKPKYRQQQYSIKCSPLDFEHDGEISPSAGSHHLEDSSSMDGPPVCDRTAVVYYNLSDDVPRPNLQPETGCMYKKDDYLVFLARGYNQTHLGFQVDFFVHIKDALPQFVGTAHLLPHENLSTYSKRIPIIGLNHRPIGEVQVETMRITPMAGYDWKMDISYQNHWKWRKTEHPLKVGHRGMGSSYKKVANMKENTIKSLYSAAREGADFVEFDVLLSKDNIPVIYHDFSVCLSTARKATTEKHLLEVPVKDLKLYNLQSLRLFHSSSNQDLPIEVSEDISDEEDQPFPTLENCLKVVDSSVGFNIEVKYPQQLQNGESEMDNYFDLNPYLDRILDVVFKHAGDRKIVFSTFHPDSCVMLNLKQNRYPLLFLSNGPSKRYMPYSDFRCATFINGIKFAKAEGLLGVNLQADGLLMDLNMISYIRSLGLVLFVWGEDLNQKEVRDVLRAHQVDAVIFDRIGREHHEAFCVPPGHPNDSRMQTLLVQPNSTSATGNVDIEEVIPEQYGSPLNGVQT